MFWANFFSNLTISIEYLGAELITKDGTMQSIIEATGHRVREVNRNNTRMLPEQSELREHWIGTENESSQFQTSNWKFGKVVYVAFESNFNSIVCSKQFSFWEQE